MTIDEAREILEKLIPQPQRGDGKSITHLMITEALNMAIKALEQQSRDCKTCKHSDNGNCAGTEECHECMWESKYEQQPCDDCISRKAVMFEIGESYNIVDLEKRIKDLPSVQPTRPEGKWIILDECANEGVYCSECHKKVFKLEFSHTMKWRNFKYCPNCGVDMKESDKG